MNFKEFSPNHMGVVVHCQTDGSIEIVVGHNFDKDFDEELGDQMLNLLQGLKLFVKHHPTLLAAHGSMYRELKNIWGDEFGEDELIIDFEPDDELVDKVNQPENVVPLTKGRRVH